jgi:NADH-quinone oxidoreductase subunit N
MFNGGEIFLAMGISTLLTIYALIKEEIKGLITILIFLTIGIILMDPYETQTTEWIIKSEITKLGKILVLLGAIPFIRRKGSEYQIIMGLTVLGVILLISAGNIISLYLGLELQSLGSYLLATYNKDDKLSTEAGLKYFILGAIASGIILFGLSLIYGFTGMTNLEMIFKMEELSKGTITGIIFLLIGLLFKIAAAPFHGWIPDIYEGSPTEVTGFFAVVPKISIIIMIIRIIMGTGGVVEPIIIGSTILSLVIGGLGALYQRSIKRLFGYSAILNVGFILMGLATGTIEGMEAVMTYVLIYMVTNIAIFTIILVIPKNNFQIGELKGLGKVNNVLAMSLAIALFSTAGIPPLAGFLGKYLIIRAAIEEYMYGIATLGIIMSVISAVYYIRIIQIMYFQKEINEIGAIRIGKEEGIVISISVIIITFLMMKPGWIMMMMEEVIIRII